ncbi:MAG TPA: lipocalin family protein [Rhizomicrobium sp.]
MPAFAAPSLVGTWFGQGQPGDKQSMYLDRLTADGKIHSRFRDCRNGKTIDSTEEGTWSLMGNTLTIQVELHNGLFMPRTDVYRLDSANAKDFRISYLPLNFPYDERRVDDRFEMPSCQLVS